MRYEFTFASGRVAFDWEVGTVEIRAEHGRKVGEEEWSPVEGTYPFEEVPIFTSFFVTGMIALYGIDVDVRGKMVVSSEGFVLEVYRVKEPQKGKVAFLLAYDTRRKMSSVFIFNKANLYAFLQMIKEREKVVPVGETVWEKTGEGIYVNRLPVPFQHAKALEWVLLEGLREGKYPPLRLGWNEGSFRISGRRLSVFRKRDSAEVPYLSISLKNPIDAIRILSCL